jgi:hypothetical protein
VVPCSPGSNQGGPVLSPWVGQRVRYKGRVVTVTSMRVPPHRRASDDLEPLGEPAMTILLSDETSPPVEVTVYEENWDLVAALEAEA